MAMLYLWHDAGLGRKSVMGVEIATIRCEVLVADPPWAFRLGTSARPKKFRGTVDRHYPAMPVDAICRFPLPPLADDVTLFLWRVAAMQREALAVLSAWGFSDPKGEIVWRKTTKNGKRHMGMGRRVRAEHETCLIATRGSPKVLDRSIRSVFEEEADDEIGSIFEAQRGRHSEKPDTLFEIVERLCGWAMPETHVELFARKPRPGWSTFGDELAQPHPGNNSQPVEGL